MYFNRKNYVKQIKYYTGCIRFVEKIQRHTNLFTINIEYVDYTLKMALSLRYTAYEL